MNDIIDIAKQIQKKIKELEIGRQVIKQRADDKSNAIGNYDKELSLTVLRIKNNKITEWEGETVNSNSPANLVERIAKGVCWKEKIEVVRSEEMYKCAVVSMNALSSELNGLQSLNRYLDKV